MQRCVALIVSGVAFFIYSLGVASLYERPRGEVGGELQVVLPRFVQVVLAAGDRFLAGNIGSFRSLVASTERMDAQDYRVLATLQQDVSWLHPAHEDNYYVAAAILPWNGQLEAAKYILARASDARPFDWQPPFYYGFNAWYFGKDPVAGAEWLVRASNHSQDEIVRIHLQQLAARWVAQGGDRSLAMRFHREMARNTRHKAFASFLEKRALRLEAILMLETAVESFRKATGGSPRTLSEIVDAGYLNAIPVDPFGMKFVISGDGMVLLETPSASEGNR